MRSLYALSVSLFLYTFVLGVSAATRKYDFMIEKKDVAPDGQGHHCRAQVHSLTILLGFKRSALVINGQTPGPELHLVQGDAVEVSRLKVYGYFNAYLGYRSQS